MTFEEEAVRKVGTLPTGRPEEWKLCSSAVQRQYEWRSSARPHLINSYSGTGGAALQDS